MNQYISSIIDQETIAEGRIYFAKELQIFLKKHPKINIDQDFEQKREIGENEEILCQMIRDDLISDFIVYVNKNELSLTTIINASPYETNFFLYKKNISLIEYSAFFGAIQIFKYLFKNGVELTSSLWIYSMHGRCQEIIDILETNKIQPENNSYKNCLIEAIKCHHNDVVNYIMTNIIQNELEMDEVVESSSIYYYNYAYFPDDLSFNTTNFFNFCKFDYFYLVEQNLKTKNIDINIIRNDIINEYNVAFTPLQSAIFLHNNTIVDFLIKQKKIDVNIKGFRLNYPEIQETINALILSIKCDNKIATKLLLQNKNIDLNAILTYNENGPDNSKCYSESYVAHFAIKYADEEIVKEILSHPNININTQEINKMIADNNVKEYSKSSLLELAISKNNYEITKLLLDHQEIDVNMISIFIDNEIIIERTPLMKAMRKQNQNIMKYLLSHQNIDVNYQIKDKVNEEKEKMSPLIYAIKNQYLSAINLLLSHSKIDVNQISITKTINNKIQNSALSIAIFGGNLDIIKTLLSHNNIDVNLQTIKIHDNTKYTLNPLVFAIKSKNIEIVKLLLNHPNIDVNAKIISESTKFYLEENCLFVALKSKNEEILNLLLNHPKIDVNVKKYINKSDDSMQITNYTSFLHCAIMESSIDIISNILNNKNVDVNISSFFTVIKDNKTDENELVALHCAISQNKLDVLKLLLSNPKIDVNIKKIHTRISNGGFFIEKTTALQLAIITNNVNIVQLLLIYLTKNHKLTDNLNEIIRMTNDTKIKSIIYSYID